MATPEELSQIKEMLHPDIVLDKPEQFCLLLAEIPNLRARLKCWEYMLSLHDKLVDIGPPIVAVQRSCREIAKSPSLKVVLGMILALGNYMNGGHARRGQADGFQIDALEKVVEIRDVNNRNSLLEYVILLIKDSYPEVLRFPDEIPTVANASKVNLKEIANELRKMLLDTKVVKECANEITTTTDPGDPFNYIIPPFLEDGVAKLANIRNDLLVAEKVFGELCKYFASSEDNTENFFTGFSNFGVNFRKAVAKIINRGRGNGKKLGDQSEDPMANIIANIRAGKARRLGQQT